MKLYSNPITEGTELAREDGHYTIVSKSHEAQEAILERHSDRSRIRLPIHELTLPNSNVFSACTRKSEKSSRPSWMKSKTSEGKLSLGGARERRLPPQAYA